MINYVYIHIDIINLLYLYNHFWRREVKNINLKSIMHDIMANTLIFDIKWTRKHI